jgi:hypothetical protein
MILGGIHILSGSFCFVVDLVRSCKGFLPQGHKGTIEESSFRHKALKNLRFSSVNF